MSFCDNDKIIRFLNESHFFSVLTLQSMKGLYGVVLFQLITKPVFLCEDDTIGITRTFPSGSF